MTQSVKTEAILQARSGSTRLKEKIFEPICDKPLLGWVIERLRGAKRIDRIVMATTTNPDDDWVEAFCEELCLDCVRGSVEDVLDRFITVLDKYPAETIVRATGDNPLTDSGLLDLLINEHLQNDADYTGLKGVVPAGLSGEVVSAEALRKAHAESSGAKYREHVTSYIHSQPEKFKIVRIDPPQYLSGRDYRLTVDTDADLLLMRTLCDHLKKAGKEFNAKNAIALLDSDPELLKINNHVEQKQWRNE
jgi:spore coat polysaccharide biosynthesis protein SpsF